MKIILSIIVLVLFSTTGYLFYQNIQYKNLQSENNTKIRVLEDKNTELEEQQADRLSGLERKNRELSDEIQKMKEAEEKAKVEDQNNSQVQDSETNNNNVVSGNNNTSSNANNNNSNNTASNEVVVEKETMLVSIPEYSMETNTVKFQKVRVEKSPQVLNAVYKQLFKKRGGQNGVWNGYTFDSVSIDKQKMATVILKGTWKPAGNMSVAFFRKEINAAAFQYKSVDNLIVKEGNSIIDWCMEDPSGGATGCPSKPQYWIESKNSSY